MGCRRRLDDAAAPLDGRRLQHEALSQAAVKGWPAHKDAFSEACERGCTYADVLPSPEDISSGDEAPCGTQGDDGDHIHQAGDALPTTLAGWSEAQFVAQRLNVSYAGTHAGSSSSACERSKGTCFCGTSCKPCHHDPCFAEVFLGGDTWYPCLCLWSAEMCTDAQRNLVDGLEGTPEEDREKEEDCEFSGGGLGVAMALMFLCIFVGVFGHIAFSNSAINSNQSVDRNIDELLRATSATAGGATFTLVREWTQARSTRPSMEATVPVHRLSVFSARRALSPAL